MPVIARRRQHVRQLSNSRRNGFIAPQDWDTPPYLQSATHLKKDGSSCTCCSPGCSCCSRSLMSSSPTSPPSCRFYCCSNCSTLSLIPRSLAPHQDLGKSPPLPTSPQSTLSESSDYTTPATSRLASGSCATACESTRHVPQPQVHAHWLSHTSSQPKGTNAQSNRWPFSDETNYDEEHDLDLENPGNRPVGPLGALIHEINSGLTPVELLEISQRNGGKCLFPRLEQHSIRELWAEWVRRSDIADNNRRIGEVKRGFGRFVKYEGRRKGRSADVIGIF